jgi:RNA-directed DNA polymerase
LLIKSWYARLLAVRRVTQDNRGKHTAGIDGVKVLTPPQRWRLATELRLDGAATPLRRTWIPKRGSPEQRPLGIPTQGDRARQTLVRQALEPEWEAKVAPHPEGFRPGRSGGEASAAGFHRSQVRPQDRLQVERAKGGDRLEHQALSAKRHALAGIRRQGRAW